MPIATASQAWAILARHARDEIQSLRLQELCQDNDRVSSLVTVRSSDEGTLIVDFSRQRMTLETINHLLYLAHTRGCIHFMQQELPYHNYSRPNDSLYLALRAPRGSTMMLMKENDPNSHINMNGINATSPSQNSSANKSANACSIIHSDWERIQRLSESFRRGQLRGVTGSVMKDVIVVGSGVCMHALRFVYESLLQDPAGYHAAKEGLAELLTRRTFTTSTIPIGHRRLRLVSSVDSLATMKAIEDLDAASTLVISLAMTGHEETGLASRLLKNWLHQKLSPRKPELIFSKHMLLVTGNDRLYQASKPESVFSVPSFVRCEPFATLSTMSLLPLAIIFGWTLVHDGILVGAHNMDTHMVESNPRHNLPLLLALVDLWNDAFLPSTPGRLIQHFGEAFSEYGSYVAALESQVCGSPSQPAFSKASCGMVLTGGSLYDRSQYQATKVVPAELVMTLDPVVGVRRDGMSQDDVVQHHDALLCSLFGHADEMASATNRPSTLILCGRLNAYMCGQLIALAEHRALIKAKLWNMTPLFPTQVGVSLRTTRTDGLREDLSKLLEKMVMGTDDGDEEIENKEGINLSTATLLSNYAGRTRDLRKRQGP